MDEADRLIQELNMSFERVTVHIVNQNPNVSVCAPFTRNCPHEIFLHMGQETKKIVSITEEDRNVIQ